MCLLKSTKEHQRVGADPQSTHLELCLLKPSLGFAQERGEVGRTEADARKQRGKKNTDRRSD